MPGAASWNGRWSGEGKLYAIVRKFVGKKETEKARVILAKGYYHYGWPDGWRAGITVKECTGPEARKIRKASQGFCGYDWMVTSILARGKILADHEIQAEEKPPTPKAESPSHKLDADAAIF